MAAFVTFISNFLRDVNGLLVVLDGLRSVSEVLIDGSEIPEAYALSALISNFPRDFYGVLEVLDGFRIVSEDFIDGSETPNRICLPLAVLEPPKQR